MFDQAVLEHLEAADRHAELLARPQIFARHREEGRHRPHRLGGKGHERLLRRALEEDSTPVEGAEDLTGLDFDARELHLRRALAAGSAIGQKAQARGRLGDEEEGDAGGLGDGTRGARGDDEMVGTRSTEDDRLVAAQLETAARALCARLDVREVEARLGLRVREGKHEPALG